MCIIICIPVVYRINNLIFKIYFNDHGKPHVHITSVDGEAKVELETFKVIKSKKFTEKNLLKALKIIDENKEMFLKIWREYNE